MKFSKIFGLLTFCSSSLDCPAPNIVRKSAFGIEYPMIATHGFPKVSKCILMPGCKSDRGDVFWFGRPAAPSIGRPAPVPAGPADCWPLETSQARRRTKRIDSLNRRKVRIEPLLLRDCRCAEILAVLLYSHLIAVSSDRRKLKFSGFASVHHCEFGKSATFASVPKVHRVSTRIMLMPI